MLSFDLEISWYLFSLGQRLPEGLVIFLATYLIWLLLIFALVYYFYKYKKNVWRSFGFSLLSAFSANLVNFVIAFFYFRPRPFLDLGIVPIISVSSMSKSFPSDHAGFVWALAGFVFWQNKKIGSLFFCLAFFISLGRVLAGVHYFFDVFSALIIGLIVAKFFSKLLRPYYEKF